MAAVEKSIAEPPMPRKKPAPRRASPVSSSTLRIRSWIRAGDVDRQPAQAEQRGGREAEQPSGFADQLANQGEEGFSRGRLLRVPAVRRVGQGVRPVVAVVKAAKILGADGQVGESLRRQPVHERADLAAMFGQQRRVGSLSHVSGPARREAARVEGRRTAAAACGGSVSCACPRRA